MRSSYSKTRIMSYYIMFNHHVHDVTSCVGAPGLITIFSAYIVTQCTDTYIHTKRNMYIVYIEVLRQF